MKVTEQEFSDFLDELYAIDDMIKTFPRGKHLIPTFNQLQRMKMAQDNWMDLNVRIKPRILHMDPAMRTHLAYLMGRLDREARRIRARLEELFNLSPQTT